MERKDCTAICRQQGLNLRCLRLRAGLSKRELGQQAGLSTRLICRYENGLESIRMDHLKRFGSILRAPYAAFFSGVGA